MKVHYSSPYSTDKNIGKALNDFCVMIPDEDWICLTDADAMFLTPEYGVQIEAVARSTKYDLIGCLTNRLGRPIQRHKGVFSNDFNVKNHYDIAVDLASRNWGEVDDITKAKYVAGMFMLFRKSLWNKIKFKENVSNFDDLFSTEVVKSGGKLGLMKGLYMFHCYRIWSDNPKGDREHLK